MGGKLKLLQSPKHSSFLPKMFAKLSDSEYHMRNISCIVYLVKKTVLRIKKNSFG